MRLERRISAVYKDIPGGSCLAQPTTTPIACSILPCWQRRSADADHRRQRTTAVAARFSLLARQGLAKFEEDSGAQPMTSPARRRFTPAHVLPVCSIDARRRRLFAGAGLLHPTRLGRNHPFAGEIRSGYIDVSIVRKSWDLR